METLDIVVVVVLMWHEKTNTIKNRNDLPAELCLRYVTLCYVAKLVNVLLARLQYNNNYWYRSVYVQL